MFSPKQNGRPFADLIKRISLNANFVCLLKYRRFMFLSAKITVVHTNQLICALFVVYLFIYYFEYWPV